MIIASSMSSTKKNCSYFGTKVNSIAQDKTIHVASEVLTKPRQALSSNYNVLKHEVHFLTSLIRFGTLIRLQIIGIRNIFCLIVVIVFYFDKEQLLIGMPTICLTEIPNFLKFWIIKYRQTCTCSVLVAQFNMTRKKHIGNGKRIELRSIRKLETRYVNLKPTKSSQGL